MKKVKALSCLFSPERREGRLMPNHISWQQPAWNNDFVACASMGTPGRGATEMPHLSNAQASSLNLASTRITSGATPQVWDI